jgi:hypothetical protein
MGSAGYRGTGLYGLLQIKLNCLTQPSRPRRPRAALISSWGRGADPVLVAGLRETLTIIPRWKCSWHDWEKSKLSFSYAWLTAVMMRDRPLSDRQLVLPEHPYPIALAEMVDFHGLHLEIGRAQRTVGRRPRSNPNGGNNTECIRRSFSLPRSWRSCHHPMEMLPHPTQFGLTYRPMIRSRSKLG